MFPYKISHPHSLLTISITTTALLISSVSVVKDMFRLPGQLLTKENCPSSLCAVLVEIQEPSCHVTAYPRLTVAIQIFFKLFR